MMNMSDFGPQCRSCGAVCQLDKSFIIEGVYINGQYDNNVYVCGALCVDNFVESLVDFDDIATEGLMVKKVLI